MRTRSVARMLASCAGVFVGVVVSVLVGLVSAIVIVWTDDR